MKTLIASDFHSRSPKDLVGSLCSSGEIGRAVFLGDYDEASVLRDILELDIDKIVLVGNHDYELAHGRRIYSPNLRRPLEEYYEIWGDTEEGKFIRNASKIKNGIKQGMKVIRRNGRKRIVYVHGGIINDNSGDLPFEVWSRLDNNRHGDGQKEKVLSTFNRMKDCDYDLMFRGHDHRSQVFSLDGDGRIDYSRGGILNPKRKHIISVGAFVNGDYAIFDEDSMELEFNSDQW
jgi:predicted phosphodiesterase